MKPLTPRPPAVTVTGHAHGRWLTRANRRPHKQTALEALLRRRLYDHLRTGGIETIGLVVALDMGDGVRAVLELTEAGWVCRTFLGPNEPHAKEGIS